MGKARRRWFLGIGLALAVVGIIAAIVVYRWQMPRVRLRIIAILSEQLEARVELADLQVTLGAEVRVVGSGLVLHHRLAAEGRPPLVRIERFEIVAPVMTILRKQVHIKSVHVDRLQIYIPKRAKSETERAPGPSLSQSLRGPSPVVIDSLTSDDAVLALESSKPDRPPRTFLIHRLKLTDAAFDRPVPFMAELTNPKPHGFIRSSGRFGPWEPDDPSLSALSGDYEFRNADLGTIKGIGGRLDSTGKFAGRLEQIDVRGTSKTPDFQLDIGGQPMPLDATFVVIVDGTNGDTLLNDVQALLAKTPIKARGGVVHTPGRKGRTVALDANIDGGRLEDVLRLAIDDPNPPMMGGLTLGTKLLLPPGEQSVTQRLQLDGTFTVSRLLFAVEAVQQKVDEFSRRGQGRPKDTHIQDVPSTMTGQFRLRDGVLRLMNLRFGVRGATVLLNGRYVLKGGILDFRGTVRLQARASQTVTGWKSWLMKAIDPLLAKDGAGTVLPIRITGTVKHPKFGVEAGKIF